MVLRVILSVSRWTSGMASTYCEKMCARMLIFSPYYETIKHGYWDGLRECT